MEVELKYAIADEETADRIWNDDMLKKMAEEQTRCQERFCGAYYDTDDRLLTQNDIAFRVRKEGDIVVASLKWGGDNEGALHKREELNVTIGDEIPDEVDLECFKESDIGEKAIEIAGDRKLVKLMETDVSRRHMRVDTGSGIHEVSIDVGAITAAGRSSPILEIEIEEFAGSEEDLLALGRQLEEQYGLVPEHRSKFARGLTLLGIEK